MKIPRRIIQVWGAPPGAMPHKESSELPLFAQASAANLRLLNPTFEYMFFDDARVEQLIDTEFRQYRSVFDAFPARIQRYDFFRYLAVHHFGGFYFDTDVFLASSLDNLLELGCVFPFEHLSVHSFLCQEYGMDWEIGNYAFGAVPGHPFLKAVIENVVRAQRHPEWPKPMLKSIPRIFRSEYLVLDTTGPGLVSRTLAEYPRACEEVKVLFPEDVLDQSSWFRFGNYGIHLQYSSWRKNDRLRRLLHRYWMSLRRRALLKESLKRGPKRSVEFATSTTGARPCGI
jgi:inositol phosphorylceramide mannosyltransferase catalytic subunit